MLFLFFGRQNFTKIHTKIQQIAPFKNIFRGACPRTPLKRMASPCAACRFATCKFSILRKIFLASPSQILATPLHKCNYFCITIMTILKFKVLPKNCNNKNITLKMYITDYVPKRLMDNGDHRRMRI